MLRGILRGILCGMLCGMLRGILCGILCEILRGTQWDGLYGENVVYKSAGNPSCLVFYFYHRISSSFLSSLFAQEQVTRQTSIFYYNKGWR